MKKENLKKLLALIGEIVKDNRYAWFAKELAKLVKTDNIDPSSDTDSRIEQRIKQIQEYLNIDFNDLIDYDDFDEPSREQLTRDCIEMCRYKKGTPSHKIDYGEFCRYATLQIEELFNYYLSRVSEGKAEIAIEFIKRHNPRFNPARMARDINEIDLTYKIVCFKNLCSFSSKTINIIWFLKDYRNTLSHRNASLNLDEESIMKSYHEKGLNLKSSILPKEDPFFKIQKDGNFIIRKKEKDFGIVFEALNEVKSKILSLPRPD